jgi:hypothetical protein
VLQQGIHERLLPLHVIPVIADEDHLPLLFQNILES